MKHVDEAEKELRFELEIPKLEENGIVLDDRLPYSLWKHLNEQAKERDYVTAYIPRGYDVYLLKRNDWLGKWEYYEVKKWTEQRQDMREYYEDLRTEVLFLRDKLAEYEDGI